MSDELDAAELEARELAAIESTDDHHPYILKPSDLPFAGPDPDEWDATLKTKNIGDAESVLEADVNDGHRIDSPTRLHRLAVNVLASFLFATGPESPESVTAGDFADDEGGEQYTTTLWDLYESFVEKIRKSSADEGEDEAAEERGRRRSYHTHRGGKYSGDNRNPNKSTGRTQWKDRSL